jgi:hypothetical protein
MCLAAVRVFVLIMMVLFHYYCCLGPQTPKSNSRNSVSSTPRTPATRELLHRKRAQVLSALNNENDADMEDQSGPTRLFQNEIQALQAQASTTTFNSDPANLQQDRHISQPQNGASGSTNPPNTLVNNYMPARVVGAVRHRNRAASVQRGVSALDPHPYNSDLLWCTTGKHWKKKEFFIK